MWNKIVFALLFCGFLTGCVTEGETFDANRETILEDFRRTGEMCGGFAGLTCPDGQVCIDDKSDSCDPARGGADCAGICVREKGNGGNNGNGKGSCKGDADKTYVAYGEECYVIKFFCEEGEQYFSDECGCGCETATF